MNKEKCIICRKDPKESNDPTDKKKEQNKLTDEHIIPDALGGHIHSHRVCKDCNSLLGEKVDPLLVNHCFMKFERFMHRISGKSKNPPNPFSGTYTGDDGRKYRIDDKDGKLEPHLLPEKMEVKKGIIHTIVDVADGKNIVKSVQKYCERNDLTIKEMTQEEVTAKGPEFNIPMEVDLEKFKLGLLKIGYEYAIEKIDNYYDDPLAIKIANILHDADVSKLNEIELYGSGFDNKDLLDRCIDNNDNSKHIIILMNLHDTMFVYINIFNSLSISIKLSDKTYPELKDGLICVNNTLTGKVYENDLFGLAQDVNVTKTELYDDKDSLIEVPYNIDPKTNTPLIFDENQSNPIPIYDIVCCDYLKYTMSQLENGCTENQFEHTFTDTRYVCKDVGFVKIRRIVIINEINKI